MSGNGEPNTPEASELDKAAPSMRLAASAAMFAEWLAQNPYAAMVSPEALASTLGDAAEQFALDDWPP